MLIDLTTALPLVRTDQCKTSLAVRVRAIQDHSNSALWRKGPPVLRGENSVLLDFGRVMEHSEGRDQKLFDFLLRPGHEPAWKAVDPEPHETHSFRLLSAIPQEDRPWATRIFWIVLYTGDLAHGVYPRVRMDTPHHNFQIEHPHYDRNSAELPEPPNTILRSAPNVPTFWDRLSEG